MLAKDSLKLFLICVNLLPTTRYEFQTNSADIKFGFDLVDGKKRTPVIKLEKYNSHMVPENGEVALPEPGTCEYHVATVTPTRKAVPSHECYDLIVEHGA